MPLYAHSNQRDKQEWQLLSDHLRNVAEQSASFASSFGCENWGRAAGLLHDIGKASAAFQSRLEGRGDRVDHSTAGAIEAEKQLNSSQNSSFGGNLIAFTIAGHHGGMPNGIRATGEHQRTPLLERLNSKSLEDYSSVFPLMEANALAIPSSNELETYPSQNRLQSGHMLRDKNTEKLNQIYAISFFTRMLFSCLVDADYLDTERFMDAESSRIRRRRHASLEELLKRLNEYIRTVQASSEDLPINRARNCVLKDATSASKCKQGLFTLTVPTGGGKTLSSIAFALNHAIEHGLNRVIVAIPFTSIVEQTAAVLRTIFGDENVLEHHSNYDFEEGDSEQATTERLATQNWDYPIIVTTNVQLLESLYSNKPGKCRKLHNIVKSVVVLDEAQTIPDELLLPSLAALEELVLDYQCTAVLCTATQPAITDRWPFGSQITEIASHRDGFELAFGNRVIFQDVGAISIAELAQQLNDYDQVLCIVGTKKRALEIWKACLEQEGAGGDCIFHLSANMIPAHRSKCLNQIKEKLASGEKCIVVSTQLVEAGVDIDFPRVYREIAGIDSIIQAAGRCNRSGRLVDDEGTKVPGEVKIFRFAHDKEQKGANSWLEKMKVLAQEVIEAHGGVITEELVNPFFKRRYQTGDLDDRKIFSELCQEHLVHDGFMTLEFEQYASNYKLIEDETSALFVPVGEEGRNLLHLLQQTDKPASMAMRLQPFSISVYPYVKTKLEAMGAIEQFGPICVLNELFYNEEYGLIEPGEEAQISPVI